ncbi:dihydroorotate dehydrogenase (quinone), mitochondrial-like [Drosophila hydei]|uniref:Dihydroorotate dehydrogenase (quinone), mitochondrial n=1 Tax=Drosophila hydei TaxID=7224 RepID=A0A6J1LJB5_DROHY|nr:dihydroorotate dehydrogenase (quinone), mitochondrial-like [Drosophila hydei]
MPHPQSKGRLRALGVATAGIAALYMGLTAYDKPESLVRALMIPTMRLLPAETGCNLALLACKYRLYPASNYEDNVNLRTKFFGCDISNPIGLAAGFDRNGEAVHGLNDLGFGFIEIGSVTPLAQKGSPRSRIFRLSADRAIINRNSIDSDGYQAVAERLRRLRQTDGFNAVVGVNLERNYSSNTPVIDYMAGVKTFGPVADYLVINYSNAKDQGYNANSKNQLIELLEAVNIERAQLKPIKYVPILLKLSPDMTLDEMKDVAAVIDMSTCKVDGLIVSNATMTRDNVSTSKKSQEEGALSGEPLRQRSTTMIAQMYQLINNSVPIIGVGGISSGQDAYEKIEAGASYLQIYTAFVFDGPDLVDRIKSELSDCITEMGYENVQEAIGSNYKRYLPA